MVTHDGFAEVADSYSSDISVRTREDILANVSKTERTTLFVDNSGWKHNGCLDLPFYNSSMDKIRHGMSDRAPDAHLVGSEFKRNHICNQMQCLGSDVAHEVKTQFRTQGRTNEKFKAFHWHVFGKPGAPGNKLRYSEEALCNFVAI